MQDCPLVSVILYGYNSARFVERTVLSLLAQDHPKIEFYLSDDGSSDGSFQIIERACAASTRPVMLHRNASNRGICNQINAGVARTTGPLVMLANADDVYPACYVSRLVDAWSARLPRPTVVWAQLLEIDELDRPTGRVHEQRTSGSTLSARIAGRATGAGATGALYDRRVFSEFGPLPDNLSLEDSCLNARAYVLGEGLHLPEPLVRYRVHQDNISQVYSGGEYPEWRKRRQSRVAWHALQGHRAFVEMLRDLHQRPAASVDAPEVKRARWIAIERLVETAILDAYWTRDAQMSVFGQWAMIGRIARLCLKLTMKRHIPWLDEWRARQEHARCLRRDGASEC